MASIKFNSYPVKQNGVYRNPKTGDLEYWLIVNGHKCMVGGCVKDTGDRMKEAWVKECERQIKELLLKHFGPEKILLAVRRQGKG